MRASRLLATLLLLQARGRMTAPELAVELEVSVRTVHRDLEALGAAGVPVWAARGPRGGYELLEGWRTTLTGLSGEEAAALALAGLPDAAAELGLGAVLAAAERKLAATLPADAAAGIARVRSRVHVDAAAWFTAQAPTPTHLADIARAVFAERRIAVRYRRWRGEVDRRLDPLGLVVKAGTWYLVAAAVDDATRTRRAEGADARVSAAPSLRTYRVDRVLALTVSEEAAMRPAGFDLAGWWARATARLPADLRRGEARLRVSPRGLALLPVLGADAADAAGHAGPADADGWREVTVPMEDVEQAAVDVLRLGADAEVLAPPALRAAIATTARTLVDRYG